MTYKAKNHLFFLRWNFYGTGKEVALKVAKVSPEACGIDTATKLGRPLCLSLGTECAKFQECGTCAGKMLKVRSLPFRLWAKELGLRLPRKVERCGSPENSRSSGSD